MPFFYQWLYWALIPFRYNDTVASQIEVLPCTGTGERENVWEHGEEHDREEMRIITHPLYTHIHTWTHYTQWKDPTSRDSGGHSDGKASFFGGQSSKRPSLTSASYSKGKEIRNLSPLTKFGPK